MKKTLQEGRRRVYVRMPDHAELAEVFFEHGVMPETLEDVDALLGLVQSMPRINGTLRNIMIAELQGVRDSF